MAEQPVLVTSKDGTPIALDVRGEGHPVVILGGAFSYRTFPGVITLAGLLAGAGFAAVNYDRRGRGGSGDTPPYAVEREIEDLHAVIEHVGGSAHVFGMSSGAALAMHAAQAGLAIRKLALYEPPFKTNAPSDFSSTLDRILAAGDRGRAVKYFLTVGMGMPALMATAFRLTPVWKRLTAVAHTLPYDVAVMRTMATPSTPTLLIDGEKSPQVLRDSTAAVASALPHAQHQTLPGQGHAVSWKVLAPVLAEYLEKP